MFGLETSLYTREGIASDCSYYDCALGVCIKQELRRLYGFAEARRSVRSGHKMGISVAQRERRPSPRGNVIEPSLCAGVECKVECWIEAVVNFSREYD